MACAVPDPGSLAVGSLEESRASRAPRSAQRAKPEQSLYCPACMCNGVVNKQRTTLAPARLYI